MHTSRIKCCSQYIRGGDFELLFLFISMYFSKFSSITFSLHRYVLFQILFYDDILFFPINKRSWPQTFSHVYVMFKAPSFL